MNHPKANYDRPCATCVHFTDGQFPRCRASKHLISGAPMPTDPHAARSTKGHCGPAGKRWEAIEAPAAAEPVPPMKHQNIRRNGAATVAALALAILAAWSPPAANAEHAPTFRNSRADCYRYGNCDTHYNRPRYSHDYVHYAHYRKRRHHHYYYDDGCKSSLTREGDQYASEEGAKKEAIKAWQQAARWRFGEMYMDIKNASNVKYLCGRSSVGEVVGQTFHRCQIEAKPCKPERH